MTDFISALCVNKCFKFECSSMVCRTYSHLRRACLCFHYVQLIKDKNVSMNWFHTIVAYTTKSSTHSPLVPHTCVGELGHHWFR